jgi:hypothetical protein
MIMSVAPVAQDTPTQRANVEQLTDDECDVLLFGIRERRLRAFTVYSEAQELKQKARNMKTREQIQKFLDMFNKELKAADKAIEKLEARALKIRALRLEVECD